MGIYTEYLDSKFDFHQLTAERKKQLKRISKIRGRGVLVYAADLNKGSAPISISYPDLLPINDQLANITGDSLDLILETPGGLGEVAEDIVRLIREKFKSVGVIIPGWAKSAGTLIAMAGDEILMDSASAIGPIDAQLTWQGKQFSADALLKGMEKIKKEVTSTGILNKAYIPILQGISPGELQSAENALDFAKVLVTRWLAKYKFQNWQTHSTTSKAVTGKDKTKRAKEIADQLCDHGRWLTHGRSIKLADLEKMRLKITDYSEDKELLDAIQRYHTLLQMTFDGPPIYKIFETPTSQIYRSAAVPAQQLQGETTHAIFEVACPKCKKKHKVQANLGKSHPLESGALPFPKNNKLTCSKCKNVIDLTSQRQQLEMQSKKKVVPQKGK